MKSTHPFKVKAPIESIYNNVLSAEGWPSFALGYQSLESADHNWPDEGSSIVFRVGFGPWSAPFNATVVEHERGHRFLTHEEAFSGLWIDDAGLTLEEEDGTTKITIIRDIKSKSPLIGILILLVFPLRGLTARYAKRRIKAMVETESPSGCGLC
ncbi:MAG: hypothetical protein O7D33_08555 [Chloroflexi bacterium]|nr:hypothetical protein [Chloroflexota bacterium]